MRWVVIIVLVEIAATLIIAWINQAKWKGADLGIYGWGLVLVIGISLIILNMLFAADCIASLKSDPAKLTLSKCDPAVRGWYLVLHDWQTGIGAVIGLLGVGWTAFYNGAANGGLLKGISDKIDSLSNYIGPNQNRTSKPKRQESVSH